MENDELLGGKPESKRPGTGKHATALMEQQSASLHIEIAVQSLFVIAISLVVIRYLQYSPQGQRLLSC